MSDSVRVLYVTGDPSLGESVSTSLEREHERLTVETASSASEVRERLPGSEFDCIVSEYDLAEQSGIELCDTVRELDLTIPFVLFTAEHSAEIVREATAAGVTEYLPRTSTQDDVSLLVKRIFDAISRQQIAKRAAELERINDVVRELNRVLVRASTRNEIDQRVCEVISESDPYLFAWIGEHDPEAGTVTGRAAAGVEEGYLDEITITTDEKATAQGPTGRAVRTHELQVMQNIPDDPAYEPWREQALERGYRSSAAIPLAYEGSLYGVLNVYADRVGAFEAEERKILTELGDTIAYALDDVRMREKLRNRQRAIEQAADAIFITDPDGTIEYVNPAFETLTGYSTSDAIGRTPRILRSGEMDEQYYETMWEAILAGEIWEEEIVNAKQSGEYYHAEQTIAPLTDESGHIDGFVAIQRDVTERKERERELQRSKARLRILFDQAPDGVIVHDQLGEVLDVNTTLTDMLGYTRGELLSMNVHDFEVGLDEAALKEEWASMAPGAMHKIEVEGVHRRKDGSTYPVEVWVSRVTTESSSDRFLALVRDITGRKQRIRQLRVLDRVLRHNLNNEMSIIRGYAQTIDASASGEVTEYAREIVTSCDQLLETAEKEREIVQIVSQRPENAVIDLVETAERIVESLESAHPDARITFEGPARARAEATTNVDRAIEELLENAIVHSDRAKPEINVDVTCSDGTVTVRIEDDGPGIPEEEVGVLIEEERIDPLYHGSGLGLWLVYWIVERSDGGIRFEPNEPRGSLVEVSFRAAHPS